VENLVGLTYRDEMYGGVPNSGLPILQYTILAGHVAGSISTGEQKDAQDKQEIKPNQTIFLTGDDILFPRKQECRIK
jgi:hypothetical protein